MFLLAARAAPADVKDQDGLTTKEQYTASHLYSWFFSDRWFLSSGIGIELD